MIDLSVSSSSSTMLKIASFWSLKALEQIYLLQNKILTLTKSYNNEDKLISSCILQFNRHDCLFLIFLNIGYKKWSDLPILISLGRQSTQWRNKSPVRWYVTRVLKQVNRVILGNSRLSVGLSESSIDPKRHTLIQFIQILYCAGDLWVVTSAATPSSSAARLGTRPPMLDFPPARVIPQVFILRVMHSYR